ncbi:MAG: DUF1175 family protein [Candidatus Solibacter usitatus]|nr:DUF1175 family protein [Candidatus Solibacter usitatus]
MHRRSVLWLICGGMQAASDSPAPLSSADQRAFCAWFAWLAEAMYFLPGQRRPKEITDCSSLLRFAYREALRPHTAEWAHSAGFDWLPPLPELSRPARTPALFLTASGQARQFADAEHLLRFNAFPLARNSSAARPGDLLFYRQITESQPWHSMVCLGRSAFDGAPGPLAVYHTGPIDGAPGELRRPSMDELLRHREPRWRPVAGNANFLGVYRWNILRDTD